MSRRKRKPEECEMNMTPMIDIVFQLIIFFIVTLTMNSDYNADIKLDLAPYGGDIKPPDNDTSQALSITIEIDRKGRISYANIPMTYAQLRDTLHNRRVRYRMFPVYIRADSNTPHEHVRRVMDLCAGMGIARVSFVAIKEPKTPESKDRFLKK